MLELYVNNHLCDMSGENEVAVDYAMLKIDDIGSRSGSRSYSFELPKTTNNRSIFENPDEVNNLSTLHYERFDARLFCDGVDLGIRFAEITSSKSGYNINLYGNNATFFELVKNKKLIELDMSAYDHYWNFANVTASRANTSGYIYPIIDYGADASVMGNISRVADPRYLLPSIFADSVLLAIATDLGYTLQNDMLSDVYYPVNKLLVPAHRQARGNFFAPIKYNAIFKTDANIIVTNELTPVLPIPFTVDSIVAYAGTYYQVPYLDNPVNYPFNDSIYFQDHIRFTFKVRITVINTHTTGVYLKLRYVEGTSISNILVDTTLDTINIPPGTTTVTRQYTITLQQKEVYVALLLWTNVTGLLEVQANSEVEIADAEIVNQDVLTYGQFITVSAILPDMTQADFLKNYMQLYCLFPVIDEVNKILYLKKFNSIPNNINNVLDWSDKLDLTDEPEVKFLIDDYGQKNLFKWGTDGDEPQPIGTTGELVIDNENLELEKEIVELDFASSVSEEALIGITINKLGVFESNQFTNDIEPRLLLLQLKDGADFADTSDLEYNDGTNSLTISTGFPLTRFIATAETYNLGFGNSLLDLYYVALTDVLTQCKIVVCQLRLNASDINQLDFTKPIFIRYFNSYFYLSNVSGYRPGSTDSTETELVKLF